MAFKNIDFGDLHSHYGLRVVIGMREQSANCVVDKSGWERKAQ